MSFEMEGYSSTREIGEHSNVNASSSYGSMTACTFGRLRAACVLVHKDYTHACIHLLFNKSISFKME